MMQLQCVLTFLFLTISLSTAPAPALLDALRSSGASKFAASIESDPTLFDLYNSSQVQTVFAPSDDTGAKMKRQETPAQEQSGGLQASGSLNTLADMNKRPGAQIPTKDSNANLGGRPQSIVSDSRKNSLTGSIKRGASPLRRDNQNTTLPSNTTFPSLLSIFSGLGNSVSIIQADIPYDRGLIHIVDEYGNNFFTVRGIMIYNTLPQTLSATTYATGHTTFTTLTNSSNLTVELDSTAGLTALIPTNAAFAGANISSTNPTTPSLMDGHIVPNFVGYLPALTNGLKLTTQAGTTVTVTIEGNDFYLNNAKIIASNLVLENGVAHVLDQVLSFSPSSIPPPPTANSTVIPFTGAGSSTILGTSSTQSVIASCGFALLVVLIMS